nr:sigma-70 family RNA polymerase sigma factor [Roseateles oligotrophus]
MPADLYQAIATLWRQESPKLVATLSRLLRDLDLAEDLAQEALLAALEHWPSQGLPDKPGAWLMSTAKNRAFDQLRHRKMAQLRQEELAQDLLALEQHRAPDFLEALDRARQDEVGDDMLRLIFVACHPELAAESRVALTLKLLGGLTTQEIARAYLLPEATMAQRIVRAKRRIKEAELPFDLPRGPALQQRLASVLEVIYLIFNEGYAASSGADSTRPALCREALRLGRLLSQIQPQSAEAQGLLALMALQASRLPARSDAQGRPVLLEAQDRSLWDQGLIEQGLRALALAAQREAELGPYGLQAAIAACHARAPSTDQTDWARVDALYLALYRLRPSPVIALNRVVAHAMHQGPAAGLQLLAPLLQDPALQNYPWLPAVQGDLLEKLGQAEQAGRAFETAAALSGNAQDRLQMLTRAQRLKAQTGA